jgi:hypothetical protein
MGGHDSRSWEELGLKRRSGFQPRRSEEALFTLRRKGSRECILSTARVKRLDDFRRKTAASHHTIL